MFWPNTVGGVLVKDSIAVSLFSELIRNWILMKIIFYVIRLVIYDENSKAVDFERLIGGGKCGSKQKSGKAGSILTHSASGDIS